MHELTHEELGLLRKLVERHKWDREWLGVPFPDVCDLGAKLDAMATDEDCTLKCICDACIDASFTELKRDLCPSCASYPLDECLTCGI